MAKKKKIVFSGDIGNLNQPLIKDPVYLHDADYVIMNLLTVTEATVNARII